MVGLYIHIPFCVRKCEYCDFVSYPGRESEHEAYIDAVCREMRGYGGEKVGTVFIGGGTPSVLEPKLISRLCDNIKSSFCVEPGAEFTMELNPGTVTEEKLDAMLEGGVNRASVGVQSFNNDELRAAGRIHDAAAAVKTVDMLKDGGMENISIDLMQSLPMQTAESFNSSLKTAVSLPIKHISVYSLILEEGTPMRSKYESGVYREPDEDEERELYRFTGRFLAEHGFERYEISNYALPGFESKHNTMYWDRGEYIGLGAAAHSYYGGRRYCNTCALGEYIEGNMRAGGGEKLTDDDRMSEFMMLGLRKTKGVSVSDFKERFGRNFFEVYGAIAGKFSKLGLLDLSDGRCRLTERGIDVSNTVMCEFII